MKKNIFLFLIFSALCLFSYGCGNHEIEPENSSAIAADTTAASISSTDLNNMQKPQTTTSTIVTTSVNTSTQIISQTSVTAASTSNSNQITNIITTVVTTSTTFKSPSGETNFKIITNKHAQYEHRVPSVLKPHEPVIYTTAATTSSIETNTETTELSTDISDEENPTDSQETTTETTTEPVIIEPVTPDELCFYGMTPGDNIIDLIASFGEYESMNSTPGEYDESGILKYENRHYYFTDMELITFWNEDSEILAEIIVKDSEFKTKRGISTGMTADDVIAVYGESNSENSENSENSDDKKYIYQCETGYIYFHTDENDIIDYIGFQKIN